MSKEKKPNNNNVLELSRLTTIGKIDNRLLSDRFAIMSRRWNLNDITWWTIITSQVVDRRTYEIHVPVKKARELIMGNTKGHETLASFVRRANKSLRKFVGITVTYEKKDKNGQLAIVNMPLFDISYIDTSFHVRIKIKPEAIPYFNSLQYYTRYGLREIMKLHSTYAVRLYLELKRWRTVGKKTFTIAEFKQKLDIPKSYYGSNLIHRIVIPSTQALTCYFQNLHFKRKYAKGKHGRKLSKLVFLFTPEKKNQKGSLPEREAEVRAIHNIETNKYLTQDERFRLIDRYENVKIGTTKKRYNKAGKII